MRYVLFCLLGLLLASCYSFRGISIPEGVERAYVPNFRNNALNAPPTLFLEMTESFRDKVRDEARLIITEDAPDIEIKGTLVDFNVSAEGATAAGDVAAFARNNRLTIVVAIEYTNLLDPKAENWKSNFSSFFEFPGNQTLASVEDEAIAFVTKEINEKIFNRAFTGDW